MLAAPRTPIRIAVALLLGAAAFGIGPVAPASAATTSVSGLSAGDESGSPYWITTAGGDVWNFGSAVNYGTLKGQALNKPIVAISPTPDAGGYWLTASDGGIFAFGNATFLGSTGNSKLNQPIVGMTPTPTNKGYWMVARDGGIFAYGDAAFYGSTGGITLNKPIVAMAPTKTGRGYWLAASDGGIFAFGDALFHGSAGGGANSSYQRILAAPDNKGYWLLRNGGDAVGFGSVAGVTASGNGGKSKTSSARPAVGLLFTVATPGDNAVLYAMAQLGKDYVWGGNGPNGFDCSGLTSASWRNAGTVIPRIANDQYDGGGAHVELDQLRPGDLLFWGPDSTNSRAIDHVGMYIGGGWGVNAGGTGTGVNVRSIPRTSSWMMGSGVRPKA